MTEKLGIKKRKNKLERAIGKWIVITVNGNGSTYGKVKEVDGREITFNPSRALRYNNENKCNLYKFIDEDSYLEVSPQGYLLEFTNKETLDYRMEEQNENILKEKIPNK